MYNFNQVFVDKLKASGVDITCDPESIRRAIATLDNDSSNIDDVEVLSWVEELLDIREDFLLPSAVGIEIALSALDEPSKALVLDKLEEYFMRLMHFGMRH